MNNIESLKNQLSELDAQIASLRVKRYAIHEQIADLRRREKEIDVCCKNCVHVVKDDYGRYGCVALPSYNGKTIRRVNGMRDRSDCSPFRKRVGKIPLTNETRIKFIQKIAK